MFIRGGRRISRGVKRNPQSVTTFTVNYAGLNVDSWLTSAITDSDLQVGDKIIYDNRSAAGKVVSVSSDGVPTIYDQTNDDSFNYRIVDTSNNNTKVGPAKVTLNGPN